MINFLSVGFESQMYYYDLKQFCAVPNAKSSLGRESFFAVFDGHKTAEIAEYLKTCLFPAI